MHPHIIAARIESSMNFFISIFPNLCGGRSESGEAAQDYLFSVVDSVEVESEALYASFIALASFTTFVVASLAVVAVAVPFRYAIEQLPTVVTIPSASSVIVSHFFILFLFFGLNVAI